MPEVTDPDILAVLETPQSSINEGPKPAKPLPAAERTKLEEQVTALSSFERATNKFLDDYSGFGAGLENTAQAYAPSFIEVGTPGQRDWWSDFKLTDAALRNALFGASLTPGEKVSFQETTISPGMNPKTIRENLERRRALAREVLARRARSLKAGPYDTDEITALLGDYDPDSVAQPSARPGQEAEDRIDPPSAVQPLSVDVTDDRRPGESEEAYQARIAAESPSFWEGTKNAAAGLAQGVASIPDAVGSFTRGIDSMVYSGIGSAADWLGLDWFARAARHKAREQISTPTIGSFIEDLSPTPNAPGAGATRFGASLVGGAASLPSRATTAITNALVGSVPAKAPVASALRPSRAQVARDAFDLGIEPMPATTGGPTTRLLTAATAQTPGGTYPIARGVERMAEQGGAALRNIASREGAVANVEAASEAATKGALKYRSMSRSSIGRLYDRAAEIAGEARVAPAKALQTLDENIAELTENPAADAALPYLTMLRDTLVNKFKDGVTVAGIRGMRTQLRDKFYRDGLRGSDIERRMNGVVQSISDDLADSLTAAGKSEAADLYREADAAWAARVTILDDFLMPIIGKKGEKSGEQVFSALQSAANSNGPRLREFIQALPEDEAGTVRASLINALGRASKGGQNAAGDAFSFETFLTRWSDIGEKARNALFTGEGRDAIDKLARVADQVKRTSRFTNRSNTGSIVMTGLTATSGYAGWEAMTVALGSQFAAGVLFSSPKVAAALAKIGTSRTPAETKEAIKGLSVVAARNPALADEITALQGRLLESLSEPGRLAAEQDVAQVRQ